MLLVTVRLSVPILEWREAKVGPVAALPGCNSSCAPWFL